MEQIRTFVGDGDRYMFDFKFCQAANGWAQVDTAQDAWYYGNWANPFRLELISYAEGDVCRTKCDTEAEFKAEIERTCAWHTENDGKRAMVDGMCRPEIIERFKALGLEEWMH